MSLRYTIHCDNCEAYRHLDALDALAVELRQLPPGWGSGIAWGDDDFEHLCFTCMVDFQRSEAAAQAEAELAAAYRDLGGEG